MCLADFESYFTTYHKALDDYKNRAAWTTKAIHNIAGAGYFASDRSIREYADNIWNIKSVTE
jgi:starch phosphorylase